MRATYHLQNLTVEEVFAEVRYFCDCYKLVSKRDLANIQLDLSFDEFGKLCEGEEDWDDFLPYFGLALPEPWWGQWKSPLTIRDLCVDIASRIRVPVSEPVTILGNRCESAGMFSMMKQLLAEQGADTTGVAPSTPIGNYARRHPDIFCRSRLARRGRLPEPTFNGWGLGCYTGIAASIGGGLIAYFSGSASPWNSFMITFLSAMVAAWIPRLISQRHHRHPVSFHGIVTFRDFIHAAFDRPVRVTS